MRSVHPQVQDAGKQIYAHDSSTTTSADLTILPESNDRWSA